MLVSIFHILSYFFFCFFFFNDTATTEIYTNLNTLSLHDALPISSRRRHTRFLNVTGVHTCALPIRSEEHTSELQSHSEISYAVFCLRSEERRVGKSVKISVDLGGRRIIKKKKKKKKKIKRDKRKIKIKDNKRPAL